MIMIMIIAQSFHHYHFRSEYLIPRVFWSVFPYFSLNFVHSSHLNSHRHSPHRTQGQARREAAKASAGEGSMKPYWKPRRRRTWARQKNHETWGLFEREKWGGIIRETFEVKTMQTWDFQQQRGNFGQEKIRFEQGRLQIFQSVYWYFPKCPADWVSAANHGDLPSDRDAVTCQEYLENFSPAMLELTQYEIFALWTKKGNFMGTAHLNKIEQTACFLFFSSVFLHETEEWFKANYRDCVEGLLSMVLYLSLIMDERRATWSNCEKHVVVCSSLIASVNQRHITWERVKIWEGDHQHFLVVNHPQFLGAQSCLLKIKTM